MVARRLRLMLVASLCGLTCVLWAGAASAVAAPLFSGSGEEAGQIGNLFGVYGMAVDRATGDVYVSDRSNQRVDKFDGSGKFLMAWGWGVANGAQELQTCTTSCRVGDEGYGPGELCLNQGLAVDNDPLSASYGDVYVESFCGRDVEKFDSSGKFLLAFGGHVNETTDGNVCVAGEACRGGTTGAGDGEFEWSAHGNYIAVGPGGAVYVGDKARVQVFEPSGAWKENISLSALSSTGDVTALAVDSAGDVFVKDEEVAGVREFEPNGVEKGTQFDAGSTAVAAVALDGSGDLYVVDESGGVHFLEYGPSGKGLASFGLGTLASASGGVVFDEALGELLVYGSDGSGELDFGLGVWGFTLPGPGPLVEPGSESATPGQRGTATLEASVNPEGNETTYRFEYVDQAHFQANGYASATSTPAVSIGSSIEDQPASAHLTGLVPGETYHYRVVATNSQGTTIGLDGTVTTVEPALVEGPWAVNVAGTSVTLEARIDPLGASTEYRLEYGTSTSYGHTLAGDVGEGTEYVPIGYHEQELQPGTVYHYRIVTVNEVGTVEGSDHTFTTQTAGGELALPDERAWELVSPANKEGALIEPPAASGEMGEVQAAAEGNAISYVTTQSVGEKPEGKTYLSQVLSSRGSSGWGSENITIPYRLPKEENGEELFEAQPEYRFFSSDLSLAVIEPKSALFAPLPEAKERTLYLRDDANGTYVPLVNDNNVPPGTKYGGRGGNEGAGGSLHFRGATPDLSHVLLESAEALTPEAKEGCPQNNCGGVYPANLYEWSAGRLQLVNVWPDGETQPGVSLPGGSEATEHVISSDGRRIVWSLPDARSTSPIYVRDMVEDKTAQVSGRKDPLFQTMSSDGSRIFYLEGGDLYEFDVDSGIRTDLTADHGAGESGAGVKEALLGVSKDGSYVYFVATGVLANGAVRGEDNLYILHDVGSEWKTTHIASISGEDEKDWGQQSAYEGVQFALTSSRISPDGRYLAFMSNRSLTGYDNIDASSGQPDEEVYLYDATSDRLTCASCNPTGARPVGVLDTYNGTGALLVDRLGSWAANTYLSGSRDHWLAGSVPGWEKAGVTTVYQPRYLSDSGRLFFDSPDALVSQDTNGLEDVYEYEPAGIGGCTSASVTFGENSDGCVNLISSGSSSGESAFVDASENGDDAFFVTSSRLTAADYDTSYDMYDAHVCSASVPCVALPVSAPPCTSGDSCKAAPSPQPEIFGPAPSATFSGTGNVVSSSSGGAVKSKTLTQAQKLARALAACRKKKGKGKRAACERQARRRYPAKQARKAKATRKGHG
jgi:hypothetical protein